MSILLCADLHLTDLDKDADRWNLFPWIEKQVSKHSVTHVLILGDLTDSKDRHSAKLVNGLVKVISNLAQYVEIIILCGNHDFIDKDNPFFEFLKEVKNVTYISKPTSHELGMFLPCTRDYKKDWENINFKRMKHDIIFTHNTFDGCLSENGTRLEGIPPSVFKEFKGKVWSGDIHTAQKVGKKIEYVGAPYPVKFGDPYTPRCVLLSENGSTDLHFPYKKKELIVLDKPPYDQLPDLPSGSQVKIRVKLKRTDYADWKKIRAAIERKAKSFEWDIYGIELIQAKEKGAQIDLEELTGQDPTNILVDYIKRKKLDTATKEAGLEFLKGAKQ